MYFHCIPLHHRNRHRWYENNADRRQRLSSYTVYIDGLVQDWSNSIVNDLELLQSCPKQSISCLLMAWRLNRKGQTPSRYWTSCVGMIRARNERGDGCSYNILQIIICQLAMYAAYPSLVQLNTKPALLFSFQLRMLSLRREIDEIPDKFYITCPLN